MNAPRTLEQTKYRKSLRLLWNMSVQVFLFATAFFSVSLLLLLDPPSVNGQSYRRESEAGSSSRENSCLGTWRGTAHLFGIRPWPIEVEITVTRTTGAQCGTFRYITEGAHGRLVNCKETRSDVQFMEAYDAHPSVWATGKMKIKCGYERGQKILWDWEGPGVNFNLSHAVFDRVGPGDVYRCDLVVPPQCAENLDAVRSLESRVTSGRRGGAAALVELHRARNRLRSCLRSVVKSLRVDADRGQESRELETYSDALLQVTNADRNWFQQCPLDGSELGGRDPDGIWWVSDVASIVLPYHPFDLCYRGSGAPYTALPGDSEFRQWVADIDLGLYQGRSILVGNGVLDHLSPGAQCCYSKADLRIPSSTSSFDAQSVAELDAVPPSSLALKLHKKLDVEPHERTCSQNYTQYNFGHGTQRSR